MTACDEHECQRTAPSGYCLARCYCGGCPQYKTIDQLPTNTPDTYTAVDRAAILSSTGRRTNVIEFRAAQEAASAARARQAITREGTHD